MSIELNSLFYPRRFFSEYLGIKIGAKATAAGTAIATQGKKIIEGVKNVGTKAVDGAKQIGTKIRDAFRNIGSKPNTNQTQNNLMIYLI